MAIPQVIVEVAFSVGASTGTTLHLDDVARGNLDTGTLAADVTWTDISEWVLGVSTTRGARRIESPVIRYEPGTATILLDNSDRRFDPANLAGPYVAAGVTQVTPMRAMRIRAIWSGITYDIWRGFADEWRIQYADPSWSQVVLSGTDAFKVLANFNRAAGPAVGAGEDASARVNRILDSIGWSATDRFINMDSFAGGVTNPLSPTTLQATTLADNTLTELRLTADSEIGELYIDGAGRVAFRIRQAMMIAGRSVTSQVSFGDGGGGELPFEELDVAYDEATVWNRALITRTGGTQQQADDTASQSTYLVRSARRTDLIMETDAGALDWARYVVSLAREPELRFASMTFFPRENENNLFAQALARQIGDRITVTRRPPGGGSPITRDVFIRGISHDISDELIWRTTFMFESATRYKFLVLDNATFGTLDSTNVLGF